MFLLRKFVFSVDVDEKSTFWNQLQKDIEKNMTSDDNTAHPWLEDFNSVYNTPHKVVPHIGSKYLLLK